MSDRDDLKIVFNLGRNMHVLMKYLILFLFITSCNFCFGQGAKFQLLLTKACSAVEQLDTSYYLIPLGHSVDTTYSPKKGTTYLPSTGRYRIGFIVGPIIDADVIEIRDTSLFIFRYHEPKIQRYMNGTVDSPPVYVMCDSLINGYAEDFYLDGKLKIRGDFKKGYPKDSIVTFYATGKTKKRTTILPKVIHIEEYDSLGHLVKQSYNQNKSFMTYRDYQWTEFYPNGKIKAKESSVKRVVEAEAFYPSGQLKLKQTAKNRTEYHENGQQRITYTWKSKKDATNWRMKTFTVYKNEYDERGQMLQAIIFECLDYSNPQPELDIARSSRIISIKKYQDGKEVSAIEDMETKDYLKNYPAN